MISHRLYGLILPCLFCLQSAGLQGDDAAPDPEARLAEARMELMRTRAHAIQVSSAEPGFPPRLEPEPLFRYDDHTRGYIDGTVWRLGKTGRPLAIITTELHPKYAGVGPRVVYDYLSLSDVPFSASSEDSHWSPTASAVKMQEFPEAPVPAASETVRRAQLKALAGRIEATQEVEGQKVQLRLLPQPIDRYRPEGGGPRADGGVFLFCNGRNPAIMLYLESDGERWSYGMGRLSLPSVLIAQLDGKQVWRVESNAPYSWSSPYCASNSAAIIPGYEE